MDTGGLLHVTLAGRIGVGRGAVECVCGGGGGVPGGEGRKDGFSVKILGLIALEFISENIFFLEAFDKNGSNIYLIQT